MVCVEGMYWDESEGRCEICGDSCKSCRGSEYCVECKEGLRSVDYGEGVKCEGCPDGFFFNINHCEGKNPEVIE